MPPTHSSGAARSAPSISAQPIPSAQSTQRAQPIPSAQSTQRAQPIPSAQSTQRAGTPLESAARLLSEAAHDLQTPLCAVRESARLVSDGYLGPTTEEQRICLAGIFEQCDEMNQLIVEMLSVEQLRSGVPRVQRRWVDPSQIEQSVTRTAAAAMLQHQMTLVWDHADSLPTVYADPGKVSRLLLNLIGNSVQVMPGGGQILVRLETIEERGALRFSVIDHGPGMDLAALKHFTARGQSGTGGRGLGLAISRQMAALHFCALEIHSRVGEGTRVTFELPAAGPAAVADAWTRWRSRFCRHKQQPVRRAAGIRLDQPETPLPNMLRPAAAASHLSLLHEGVAPRSSELAVAVSLRVGSTVSTEVADQVELRLQDTMRMYELAYRADVRRWVLLLDADAQQAKDRLAAIESQLRWQLPAARITCSTRVELPLGSRTTRAQLCDLLIRDSLGAPSTMPASDDRRPRSGAPLPPVSQVASRRLDRELQQLTQRIAEQRQRMQQQALAIRAPQS